MFILKDDSLSYLEQNHLKKTVALQSVDETQRTVGYITYIKTENSLGIEYDKNLDINSGSLIFAQPDI